jgi:transcriptional regulator with XRE-family HTH domain
MDKYDKKLFADNLRRRMAEHGYNQTDIAKITKASNSAVSAWLRGEMTPRMDKVAILARVFGCTLADLMEAHPGELTPEQRDLLSLVPTLTPAEAAVLATTAKALKAARQGRDGQ